MLLSNKSLIDLASLNADYIMLEEKSYLIPLLTAIEDYVSKSNIVISNIVVDNSDRLNLYYDLFTVNAKEESLSVAKILLEIDPINARHVSIITIMGDVHYKITIGNIILASFIEASVEFEYGKAQFIEKPLKYISKEIKCIKSFHSLIDLNSISDWPPTPEMIINNPNTNNIKESSLVDDIFNNFVKDRLLCGEIAAKWYRDGGKLILSKRMSVISKNNISYDIDELEVISEKYKSPLQFDIIELFSVFDPRIKKLSVKHNNIIILDIYDIALYYPILYTTANEFKIAFPFAVMMLAFMENNEAYNIMNNVEKIIPIDNFYGYYEDYEITMKKIMQAKKSFNNVIYLI